MVFRVAEPGRAAFRLRPGEQGISVFDPDAVSPSLTEQEVLANFRAGSILLSVPDDEIAAKGLTVVPILAGPQLPQRLQVAHAEIRPGARMTRAEFKQALKELEP